MKGRSGLLVALVIAVVMTAMVWTVPKDRILASSGRSLAVTASQAAVYSQVYVKTDEDRITASRLGTVVEDYGTFVLIESRSSDELSSRVKSFATNLEVKQLDTSLNLRSYRYEPTKFDPTSRFEVAGGYKAVADVTGDYYLVQFIGPVTDEWLGEVKQAGGEIIQYVPNQAFLIHADASAADKIKSSRHVRWMGTYQAAHKLSKELMWAFGDEQKADPDNSLGNYGKTAAAEYEVAVFSRANKEDLLSQLKRVNAEVSKTITLPNSFFNIVRVKLDPAAVKVVAAMKDVLAIDPYIAPSNATEKGRLSDFAIELLTSSIATSHISSSTNEGSYDLLAAQYDSFVQDSSESASLEPLTIILSTNRMLSRPAAAKNILTVGSLQAQSADGRSRPELLGSLTEAVDAAKEFTSFWRNNNGGRIPSPALVKAALINSTTEGEAVSASNVVNSTTSTDYIDQTEALTKPGQSYSFSATVADSSKPVKVTLAWTDPAALVDPALVNNLDLEVMVDGQTYKGNVLREGVSVLGGRADSTNNVETVVLPAGISGNVTINVVATSLNGDGILGNQDTTDQHFALAVSNIRPEVGEVITAAGSTLVMEGCPPNNNAIDPGERVTVSFALQNTGTGNATDVVATLQTTGGVTMPSGPQNYGTLVAGGPAVSRNFTFVVDPSVVCGGTVTATLNLGALGSVNFTLTTGTTATVTTTFRNTARINVPGTGTIGNAAPYPSNISVSGVTGTISKVTVKLNTFNHTFPDDTDILLVSPTGQKVVIFSDVGGSTDAVNLTFTLDDAAAAALPDAGPLVSGTFRPTNIGATDTFAAPAPAAPYGSTLSTFNGQNPNGTWNLYIVDDTSGDSGSFNGGWELNISTTARVCTTPCINTPALSINNATVTEGNSGTVNAVFTVSISNASPM
ncbi:MAG: hypothetical protein JNN15_15290, partial [Blastocatellia bacterium]|nr:hypothetical protein [Blastocatellia bacterium]